MSVPKAIVHLQMAHVAGEDVRGEREQDVDDCQHQAVPQVPVARGEELRLQPRHLPLWPGGTRMLPVLPAVTAIGTCMHRQTSLLCVAESPPCT